MDAIKLLKTDHKLVKELLAQLEETGERATKKRTDLLRKIQVNLKAHTTIEEEIFYPAVRAANVEEGEDMVDEAIVEHASAKDLIKQLQEMQPDDELYDAKVKVLSEQIEHHVKEEEKEMFPKARKAGLDLLALGQEMAMRKQELMSTL